MASLADGIAVKQAGDMPLSLMRRGRGAGGDTRRQGEVGGQVDGTEIFFTLETRGREHAEQLIGRLAAQGFQLEEQR